MKASTLQRISMTACAVIAAAALFVMAVFVVITQRQIDKVDDAAREAQATVDLVLAQRVEARVATCQKDLKIANAHNKLVYALAGTRQRSPKEQAAIDALAAEQLVEVPDCTPQGIADFYARQESEKTPDGAVGSPFPSTTTTTPVTTSTRRTTTTRPRTSTTGSTTTTTYYSSPTTPPCTILPDVTTPPGFPCL